MSSWGYSSTPNQKSTSKNIGWGKSENSKTSWKDKKPQNNNIVSRLKSKLGNARKRRIIATHQTISLYSTPSDSKVFEYVPRDFTIMTNNTSAKFNTYFLSNSSSEINLYLGSNNPDNKTFKIDIDDNQNILQRFEQLFQGKTVTFKEDEVSTCQKIKNALNLKCFLNFQIANKDKNYSMFPFLLQLANKDTLKSFIIHTKKERYICNRIGVLSSSVIRDFIAKNPQENNFTFEYEDDQKEFKYIANLFNGDSVELSTSNASIIKEIAEELGIDCIMASINEFIDQIEKVSQAIDDQQNIIDTIDNLFDLLYQIKEKKVDFVANSIEDSVWSQSEGKVMELAAFILQVVRATTTLQPYLIDLMVKLNEDGSGHLKILLPFFIKKLLDTTFATSSETKNIFSENDCIFPFLYMMIKRGLIPQEEVDKKIKACSIVNSYFASWFLPQLIEKEMKILVDSRSKSFTMLFPFPEKMRGYGYDNNHHVDLLYPSNPKNLEEYKNKRDKFEYDDEIAVSLRNDDVDTFQSIVTKVGEQALKNTVLKNMFEPFMSKNLRYIDYAAAYGSIKCFKYLLLNNEKPNEFTFDMAVFGGNIELIRIVDNEKDNHSSHSKLNFQTKQTCLDSLYSTIKSHKNQLFDWILEKKSSLLNSGDLANLAIFSIKNGNAHSLVQLIDNGFNINDYTGCNYSKFIEAAADHGYLLLVSLLFNLSSKNDIEVSPDLAISFGNIEIFKLCTKKFSVGNYLNSINIAIKYGSLSILQFILNKLDEEKYQFTSTTILNILDISIKNESIEILDYLIDNLCSRSEFKPMALSGLLTDSIKSKKDEPSIKIAKLIYDNNPSFDFTNSFVAAIQLNLSEIIKFIINQKYSFDENKISVLISGIGDISVELFDFIYNNMKEKNQKIMTKCIDKAVICNNKPLIKSLLNIRDTSDGCLIEAVKTNDFELVDMILEKNSSPSFINSSFPDGTALIIATKNNNIQIFKKLISIKGINPSIYHKNYETALSISASCLYEEIFNLVIDFYGDDIKNEDWQLKNALELIINRPDTNKNQTIINKILIKIINLNVVDMNFLLHNIGILDYAIKIYQNDVFMNLIKIDKIDLNIFDPKTGDTPLITAIKTRKENISKILIENKQTNINHKNYERKTALYYAVTSKQKDIVELLLKNDRFDPVECNINESFSLSNSEIMKLLLTCDSIDVNTEYSQNGLNNYYINGKEIYRTKLIDAIIFNDEEIFDLLIHHPSFVKNKSNIIDEIDITIYENKPQMISKLLNLMDDVNINSPVFTNNTSLLITAINENPTNEIINFILDSPDFDSSKSGIVEAFKLSCLKYKNNLGNSHPRYWNENRGCHPTQETLDLLLKYDENHDKLIDLNNPIDKDGSCPLEYAIRSNLPSLAKFFIETKKIDTNKQIKSQTCAYTSYLNLAASLGRNEVFKVMLSSNEFNINITNDLGDTPLIEACRMKNYEMIKELFNKDELDFLHKNKEGKDAIQISKEIKGIKLPMKQIVDKLGYLNELFVIFNRKNEKLNENLNQDKTDENDSNNEQNKSDQIESDKSDEHKSDKGNDLVVNNENEAIKQKDINESKEKDDSNNKNHSKEQQTEPEMKKGWNVMGNLINSKIEFKVKPKTVNDQKTIPFSNPYMNKKKPEFSIHNESFSEEPDSSLHHFVGKLKDNDTKRIDSKQIDAKQNDAKQNNAKQNDIIRNKFKQNIQDIFNNDDEIYQYHSTNHPYYDQNQDQMNLLIQQQQQQQWFQMIQMNNQFQNQINMEIMKQFQINQRSKTKKRKIKK